MVTLPHLLFSCRLSDSFELELQMSDTLVNGWVVGRFTLQSTSEFIFTRAWIGSALSAQRALHIPGVSSNCCEAEMICASVCLFRDKPLPVTFAENHSWIWTDSGGQIH